MINSNKLKKGNNFFKFNAFQFIQLNTLIPHFISKIKYVPCTSVPLYLHNIQGRYLKKKRATHDN